MSTIESQPSRGLSGRRHVGSALGSDRVAGTACRSWPTASASVSGPTTRVSPKAWLIISHPAPTSAEFFDTGRVYSLVVEDGRPVWQVPRTRCTSTVRCWSRCSTLQACLRAFEADVQLHVAEMAPERVFVHAGVVGYRGRGILLPGRSFAGKSILVRELVRAGAQYYSDEYAVLDSAGGVHPYPRPISIRNERGARRDEAPGRHLGRARGGRPAPGGTRSDERVPIGRRMATAALVAGSRCARAARQHGGRTPHPRGCTGNVATSRYAGANRHQ